MCAPAQTKLFLRFDAVFSSTGHVRWKCVNFLRSFSSVRRNENCWGRVFISTDCASGFPSKTLFHFYFSHYFIYLMLKNSCVFSSNFLWANLGLNRTIVHAFTSAWMNLRSICAEIALIGARKRWCTKDWLDGWKSWTSMPEFQGKKQHDRKWYQTWEVVNVVESRTRAVQEMKEWVDEIMITFTVNQAMYGGAVARFCTHAYFK